MMRFLLRDGAFLGLLVSNLLLLAVAITQQYPFGLLLWAYWIQNVVIGWFARQRILKAPDYRVGGMQIRINGRRLTREAWPQRRLANFFAMHYGGFHLFYCLFLLPFSLSAESVDTQRSDVFFMLALTLPFIWSHAKEHRDQLAADRVRVPTAGMLMAFPYLRVVPMHLTIIFGMALYGSDSPGWAIALFVALKTAADLVMYAIERTAGLAGEREQTESRNEDRGSTEMP